MDQIMPKDIIINGNTFLMLCDTVQSCLALVDNTLLELLDMKDQFLLQSLPRKVLLRITLVLSRFYRAYSQTQIPVYELIHLVQLHNEEFNQKCMLLKRLYNSHEIKKRMLNIALQRIESIEKDLEQYHDGKSIDNWEKMYIRLALPRSNVRKWKFRVETFREKAILGYEYVTDWLHTTVSRPSSPSSEISDVEESIDEQDIDQLDASDDGASSVQEIERENLQIDHNSDRGEVVLSDHEGSLHHSAKTHKSEQIQPSSPITMVDNEIQVQPELEDQETSIDDNFSTKSIIMRIYRPIGILRTTFQCVVHTQGQIYRTKEWKFNKMNNPTNSSTKNKSRAVNSTMIENNAIDKQQNDELLITISNMHSKLQNSLDSNSIKIDVLGDKMLFGSVILSPEDLQMLNLPVLNNQMSSPLIAMDHTIRRTSIRYDLDQPSNEIYQTCLSDTPQTFPVYNNKHEPIAELPLLMFWYNKTEYTHATKSTMTVPIVENEIQQTIENKHSKSISTNRIETMTIVYEYEITQIHENYQAEIQRLTELLHEKLSRQSSQLVDIAENDGNISKIHQEGVSNVYIRRQQRKSEKNAKQHQQVYLSRQNSSDSFLDRNQIYSQQRLMHRHQLISKISKQTSSINERQMEIHHRLHRSQQDNAYDDLCLPGVFMPLNSNHVYNPRAYQYFHPIGTREPRLTQPPSIFKLPAVPSGSISVLNLFELTRCQNVDNEKEPKNQ